jgi:hypothetical protein
MSRMRRFTFGVGRTGCLHVVTSVIVDGTGLSVLTLNSEFLCHHASTVLFFQSLLFVRIIMPSSSYIPSVPSTCLSKLLNLYNLYGPISSPEISLVFLLFVCHFSSLFLKTTEIKTATKLSKLQM